MDVIGGLIKETTKLASKKYVSELNPETDNHDQTNLLYNALTYAQLTDFGIVYKFNEIVRTASFLDQFKKNVPITDYESFSKLWLKRSLEGKANVYWPGKIKNFALTSGTTGASSKRIPVSNEMIQFFNKTAKRQVLQLHQLDIPTSVYESSALLIGGSTELKKFETHKEGDLSGILIKNKSLIHSMVSKPGKRISKMTDWNEKMNAIVKKAPKWNIGVIAGVPAWTSILLERIISEYNLTNIHEIWPHLSVYMHGGVFLEPYEERLKQCFGNRVHFKNTYLASEGYFAYQEYADNSGDMKLLTNHGVFYEFIDTKYLDKIQQNDYKDLPTLSLDEVQPDKNYVMVITTYAGLWRYLNGDIIKFTDVKKKKIRIVGRTSYSLNVAGEHLSEENLTEAIKLTGELLGVQVGEFCVHTDKDNNRHKWYIGSKQSVDCQKFSAVLNHFLIELNDDYATARKHLLKAPRIKSLPLEKFYEFMEYQGKIGGQHKFPRVLSQELTKKWEHFLSNSDFTLVSAS